MSKPDNTLSTRRRARAKSWKTTQHTARKQPMSRSAYVTKQSLNGGPLHQTPEPPAVTTGPWSQITVVKTATQTSNDGLIQLEEIVTWMVDQLGKQNFPTRVEFDVRVKSVQVWNLDGKSIGLQPWDFSMPNDEEANLGGWIDSGYVGQGFPCVGYLWPSHCRERANKCDYPSGSSTPGKRRIYTVLAPPNTTFVTHVKIDWKFPAQQTGYLVGAVTLLDIQNQLIRNNAITTGVKREVMSVYDAMPAKTFGSANVIVTNFPLRDESDECLDRADSTRQDNSGGECQETTDYHIPQDVVTQLFNRLEIIERRLSRQQTAVPLSEGIEFPSGSNSSDDLHKV